jgi:hypothetical protein
MTDTPVLSADLRLLDRPFTDAEHALHDGGYLREAANFLRRQLADPGATFNPPPWVYKGHVEDGRSIRLVFGDAERVRAAAQLFAVGFFGTRRDSADRHPIDEVDAQLLAEFPQHEYVLAYVTLQRGCGNFGNLVVMSGLEGRDRWRASSVHQFAVSTLSPVYYHHVRLHNAVWPGGLSGPTLHILRTRYFDFDNPWRAVREYPTPVVIPFD